MSQTLQQQVITKGLSSFSSPQDYFQFDKTSIWFSGTEIVTAVDINGTVTVSQQRIGLLGVVLGLVTGVKPIMDHARTRLNTRTMEPLMPRHIIKNHLWVVKISNERKESIGNTI